MLRTLLLATLGTALSLLLPAEGAAPAQRAPEPDRHWGDWLEADAPFFSSVLDAGRAGGPFPAANLTPRGLILRLGPDQWAAFDVDLLRVAAMWTGTGVTPRALAPGSYHDPDRKTPGGQSPAPEPEGTVWLANGIYPGWQTGTDVSFGDPRPAAPSPEEVGRGPLDDALGRFTALRLADGGVVLEYTAGDAGIEEWMTLGPAQSPERHFRIGPSAHPLSLIVGTVAEGTRVQLCSGSGAVRLSEEAGPATAEPPSRASRTWIARVPARRAETRFCLAFTSAAQSSPPALRAIPAAPPPSRWAAEVTTPIALSPDREPFVVDEITLPVDNPWRRNVRPGDVQFTSRGTGALVTLDGDVWLAHGLHAPAGPVRWRRFASGLHEPLTLAMRDDEIHVFDRNGIWRLRDTDGNGEADRHELFSNAFAQTADMREFPNTLRLGPDGEFVIAKGGQEATTLGIHNGSVLRISADGRRATVLGYGFRQPNIGVHPVTGLVTASDQQGHYIPTTPLHIVRDRQFYGFLSDKRPREVYPAPIAEPLTWIPHAANASAMSQVWLLGARMGPLTGALVHIGFNNPELFRVLLNERGERLQASVVSVTRAFTFPPLNGSVNPMDGQLYLAGFQILGWGTTATRLAGLGRVRYTGLASTLPEQVAATDKGLLIRFGVPLDPDKATRTDSYAVTSWQYQRTFRYGSPQFRRDGTPGIDRLTPGRVYLSPDRRSVFVAIAGITPVMQMRVGWSLVSGDRPFEGTAYLTPYELTPFDPAAEGFGALAVDLSEPPAPPGGGSAEAPATPITVEEGRRLAQLYGCIACHSTDSTAVSRLGPTWKGLYGSERTYAKGVLKVRADDEYLRESILDPTARVVSGYERGESGMPSYAGVLTPQQIDAIILFIRSLQ